jgi:hypothetical protein
MKLKTKIRAGKISHGYRTRASFFATGRIAAQGTETSEVVTLAAPTIGR